MNIHKSAEDYLEMILRLQESQEYVRAVDISIGLSVTKPSVSVAMRNLKESGYIAIDKDNHIRLTDTGLSIAQKVYERHKLLTDLFTQIGVDPRTAEEDACKVEHDLSSDTFAAIKQVYSRYNSNTNLNLKCNHLRASFSPCRCLASVNDALHRLPTLGLGRTKILLRMCLLFDWAWYHLFTFQLAASRRSLTKVL